MTVLHAPDVADSFSTQLIRRTAKRLVNEGVFPASDLDDVIQELRLALLSQADNFDPQRARWSTFVKTVVRLTAATLRRKRRAEFRQAEAGYSSLSVPIPDGDGRLVDLGATVREEEYRTGLGQDFLSHTDQVDLACDVQTARAGLPQELQALVDRLRRRTLSEVSGRFRCGQHGQRESPQLRKERQDRRAIRDAPRLTRAIAANQWMTLAAGSRS